MRLQMAMGCQEEKGTHQAKEHSQVIDNLAIFLVDSDRYQQG